MNSHSTRGSVDERTQFLTWIVQNNFDQLTKRVAPLCDCKSFSFQNGSSPNYSNSDIQKLYLARYAAAYYAEYHSVFELEILPKLNTKSPTVLSIGTGVGLDLAAMVHCLRQHEPSASPIMIGVDRVEWDAAAAVFGGIGGTFCQADLSAPDSLDRFDGTEFDLIVFPRSLGEIHSAIQEKLIQALSRIQCRDQHWVVSFARKEGNYLNQDMQAFRQIAAHWNEKGFSTSTNFDQYTEFSSSKAWRTVCSPWWDYPSSVYDGLEGFQSLCSQLGVCGISGSCRDVFSRMRPMMKSGYSRWQVAEFTRKP
jgi:hypothetical protein